MRGMEEGSPRVESPYGTDAVAHIKSATNLPSVSEMTEFATDYLAAEYGIPYAKTEHIHIGEGITLKLLSGDTPYFLKISSHAIHSTPETLFPFVNQMRRKGVPLPKVMRTLNNRTYTAPFKSIFDVVYLMRPVFGHRILAPTDDAAFAFGRMMSTWHILARTIEPQVLGGTFSQKPLVGRLRTEAVGYLGDCLAHDFFSVEERQLLVRVSDLIQARAMAFERPNLIRTHVNGGFLLSNCLFGKNRLTGLFDIEGISWAERLNDLVYGLTSHTNPTAGNLFDMQARYRAFVNYMAIAPLTHDEQVLLPAAALFVQLEQLSQFVERLDDDRFDEDVIAAEIAQTILIITQTLALFNDSEE